MLRPYKHTYTRKHTRQPRSSLTCSADRMLAPWAADDPVGRAARPPYTIRQARDHPQHAAAHRAALPAKAAPPSCTNRRTAEHSAQHTPARAQHTQTHARFQHAHAHSTRASHASAAPHTEHTCPHQQQLACHNPHLTHARAHSPTAGARIGRRREEPEEPESRLEALRDPDLDPSRPQADSLVLLVPLGDARCVRRQWGSVRARV